MDIYYFTYTGTSKEIADYLGKKFKIKTKEIKTYKLPYFIWLILSFIPYLPLKANFESPASDTIILCFPKWTFNCPPVTYFLKNFKNTRFKTLVMIISYKGWGEKFYYRLYYKLASKIAQEIKIIFIKKKLWDLEIYKEIKI